MTRLAAYLVRLFSLDALALFGVAVFLLFLAQCLRSFEVVSAKGQDMLTLVSQTLLTMPTLALAFTYVCLGIGLARGLRTLQLTQELHIIHTSRRLSALFGGIAIYTIGGCLLMLLLSNIVEPMARKQYSDRAVAIAADLVSRTLTPHRFMEMTDGVTVVIGSRGANGELGSFFADDRRSAEMRRTYRADSALVAADDQGYVLQLRDGVIQYMSDDNEFSEVSFTRHDLAVDRLTSASDAGIGLDGVTTPELIAEALASGRLGPDAARQLGGRFGEGFRVLAICLVAAALAAFPHGRRGRREIPVEIVVLGAAFLERAITAYVRMPDPLLPPSGAVLLAFAAVVALAFKLRKFRPEAPREAVPA